MSKTTCPIFRPTAVEFADFRGYISQIEQTLAEDDIGICKIIPPAGWLAERGNNQINSKPVVVQNPIKQVVSGRAGVFNVDLLELKAMNMKDFADYDLKNSKNCGDTDEERERKFWKSLGCPGAWDHPIYGADQLGTLFSDEEGGSWNINKLDSIVNLLGPVPGVSSPYLYVGTWRSMFAYHVEDLNLYSINYLHSGASKSWYSIKQKDKRRFESLAVSYFVEEHQQCHEFLRHKTKMFSPIKLKEFGIEHVTVLHSEGEFVITFPGAYHAGFNHGLNVAESTNFATPRWFEIGSRAKRCICRPHSVDINVSRLETLYLRSELKEMRDVSQFHTNEDMGEHSRRYRCVCATDGIFDVDEDSPPSVSCTSCSLWGHCACYETESPFFCFMCKAIELDTLNGTVAVPTLSDIDGVICGIRASSAPSPQRKLSPKTEKRTRTPTGPKKRKCSVAHLPEIAIGDTVSFELLEHTIGTITDTEDGLGRIHVKGTRKDLDVWIALEECTLLEKKGKRKHQASPDLNVRKGSRVKCKLNEPIHENSYQDTAIRSPKRTAECVASVSSVIKNKCIAAAKKISKKLSLKLPTQINADNPSLVSDDYSLKNVASSRSKSISVNDAAAAAFIVCGGELGKVTPSTSDVFLHAHTDTVTAT